MQWSIDRMSGDTASTVKCCRHCRAPYEKTAYLDRHQAICKAARTEDAFTTDETGLLLRHLLKRMGKLEADNTRLKARLNSVTKRKNPREWLDCHMREDTYYDQGRVLSLVQDDLSEFLGRGLAACAAGILSRYSWDAVKCLGGNSSVLHCHTDTGWCAMDPAHLQEMGAAVRKQMWRLFNDHITETHMDVQDQDLYMGYMSKVNELQKDKIANILKKELRRIVVVDESAHDAFT